ncbi:MAG: diguanylate cyclase [Lapillicoccus sp.]
MSKRTLLLMSHAMEQTFAEVQDEDVLGLALALFQRREYFDVEAERYAELARAGHTVIVAFAGDTTGMPEGVNVVQLAPDDPRTRRWTLLLLRGGCATSLKALDRHEASGAERTLQGSRTFDVTWTFCRSVAVDCATTVLDELARDLPREVIETARHHIRASAAIPVTDVEARLVRAAERLVHALGVGGRRNTRLAADLAASTILAELDQLTGLNNRRYLERFLGDQDSPADLVAMLVDVDNLKAINDAWGHDAGDAVLTTVARVLREQSRPGDVLIRWGGDEFLLLLPLPDAATSPDLLALGERLAVAVGRTHPPPPWSQLNMSVSIGVCASPRIPLPVAQLDAALYAVKRTRKGHAGLWPHVS